MSSNVIDITPRLATNTMTDTELTNYKWFMEFYREYKEEEYTLNLWEIAVQKEYSRRGLGDVGQSA